MNSYEEHTVVDDVLRTQLNSKIDLMIKMRTRFGIRLFNTDKGPHCKNLSGWGRLWDELVIVASETLSNQIGTC